MKPTYTLTLSRRPQSHEEQVAVRCLMDFVDLCFQAYKLDIKLTVFPVELELKKIFNDESRERIVREVSSTTRMVAFISFHGDHASVEITFSYGKTSVKMIRVRYDFNQKQLILIAETML
ncbi:MAG: hypothetical protein WCJ74_00910 [bacterium]